MVRWHALGAVLAMLACDTADAALTHSWHADGDTLDAAGSAPGTLNNGAVFAAGLINQGFSLDGADDTVTFGTTAGNVGAGDFTIAFAIKTPNPTERAVVLTKRASCAHGSFLDVHSGTSGTIGIELDQDGSGTNHSGVGSLDRIDDGVFHTAVVTRQGQTLTWVIDGVPSGSDSSVPAADVSNAVELTLGTGPCVGADGVSVPFTGVIDELRIADDANPNLLPPPVPVNLSAPSIPSAAAEGDVLACATGDWRYHPTFGFQWLRDGHPVDGAAGASYTTTSADAGHSLTCRVTASNAGGSATADSGAVIPSAKQVVTPPPPASAPPPIVSVTPAAVGLPSAKRCVSGRRFTIHLRKVRGERVTSAQVFVKGKRVRTVKGNQVTAAIDLRGLPKGRFVVRIVVTTVPGRRYAGKRAYRTCASRRKAGKHPFAAAA